MRRNGALPERVRRKIEMKPAVIIVVVAALAGLFLFYAYKEPVVNDEPVCPEPESVKKNTFPERQAKNRANSSPERPAVKPPAVVSREVQTIKPETSKVTVEKKLDAEQILQKLLEFSYENMDEYNRLIAEMKKVGYKHLIPKIVYLLRDPNFTSPRWDVIDIIRALKDEAFLPELTNLLDKDTDYNVNYWAVHAMTVIGKPAAPILANYLRKINYDSRLIVEQLGYIGGKEAVEVLGEILPVEDSLLKVKKKGERSLIKIYAINSLAEIGKDAVPTLLREFRNPDSHRHLILEAFQKIGDRSVVPDLIEFVNDTEEKNYLRAKAALTIGYLQGKEAIPDLINLTTHPDPDVKSAAIDALGCLRAESAIDIIHEGLKSDDDGVQLASARAASLMQDESALPLLEKLWPRSNYRSNIFMSMAKISGTALPVLLEITNNSDRKVRIDLVRGLLYAKNRKTIPILKVLLNDTLPHVRFEAAEALHRLKDDSGIAVLREGAKSPDPKIKGMAESMLRQIERDQNPKINSGNSLRNLIKRRRNRKNN